MLAVSDEEGYPRQWTKLSQNVSLTEVRSTISRGRQPINSVKNIRYITYLSPGIPEDFFRRVVAVVSERTGTSGFLSVESGVSGPPRGAEDPFSSGDMDVGFMCAPPFLWLRERNPSPVELLGVAPVPADSRCKGRPVYFSDVVVRGGSTFGSFQDLRGSVRAFNDRCSMSGYFGMMEHLHSLGEDESFFGKSVCSGSHAASIEMLLSAEVDCAAVDSNSLAMRFREDPGLRSRLRVVEGLGPFPIQPVVVRRGLDEDTKSRLREAFLGLDLTSEALETFGFSSYAPVTDEHYAEVEKSFRVLGESGNFG